MLDAYVPGSHLLHIPPVPAVPFLQEKHALELVEPVPLVVLPSAQTVHSVLPSLDAYVPILQ